MSRSLRTTTGRHPQARVAHIDDGASPWLGGGFALLLVTVAALSAATVHAVLRDPLPRAGVATGTMAMQAPAAAATAEAALLARTTLLTLAEANRTGDYAALRDAAAPPFQERNSPDDLARIFAGQRAAGLDLMVAANQAPRWDAPPELGPDGDLRLRGHYEAPGHLLRFALQFAPILREWRLMEISIAAEPRTP